MTQNKHINAKNEDFLQIFSQKQQVQRRLKCASSVIFSLLDFKNITIRYFSKTRLQQRCSLFNGVFSYNSITACTVITEGLLPNIPSNIKQIN